MNKQIVITAKLVTITLCLIFIGCDKKECQTCSMDGDLVVTVCEDDFEILSPVSYENAILVQEAAGYDCD